LAIHESLIERERKRDQENYYERLKVKEDEEK
jgi:hypothetical protein